MYTSDPTSNYSREYIPTSKSSTKTQILDHNDDYHLFVSEMQKILKDAEFQKDPTLFAIKWVKQDESFGMTRMPESLISAYLKRAYIGHPWANEDIKYFGENVKYPWENV